MSENGHGIPAVTGRAHCKRQVAFFFSSDRISEYNALPLGTIWAAFREKVPNVLSRCHTKKKKKIKNKKISKKIFFQKF